MSKKNDAETTKERGSKGRLLPAVVIAIGLVVGGYFMGGGKGGTAAPAAASGSTTTSVPAPGEILTLDPITLNLADGHLLKVGLALQLAKGTKVEKATKESAKALDQVIGLLAERTMTALSAPGGRDAAKEDLSTKISEAFHGEVLGVYFTEFVMQ